MDFQELHEIKHALFTFTFLHPKSCTVRWYILSVVRVSFAASWSRVGTTRCPKIYSARERAGNLILVSNGSSLHQIFICCGMCPHWLLLYLTEKKTDPTATRPSPQHSTLVSLTFLLGLMVLLCLSNTFFLFLHIRAFVYTLVFCRRSLTVGQGETCNIRWLKGKTRVKVN